MPCNDGYSDDRNTREMVSYVDNPADKILINDLVQRNDFLANCLCAIITEMKKYKSCTKILKDASKNGNVNINEFIEKHIQADKNRIQDEINKFSIHEQSVMYEILSTKLRIPLKDE